MKHPGHTQRLADLLHNAMSQLVPLLEDPAVLHISVSHTGAVWAERFGQGAQPTQITMTPAQTEQVIRLVASQGGHVVTCEQSRLATVLPSGERFQGFVPPTVRNPAFEIRKRPSQVYPLEAYVEADIVTESQAVRLRDAVQVRENIVVAGGTGSGKSTLLNALLHELRSYTGHVVTLEDVPELQVAAPYYLALYTVPGQTTLTDLVRDSLRCNPARVIVGEVRGGECLDVLDVWNTGHPGGMLSIHADPGKALRRLESLIRRAPLTVPLPQEELRELIADAVDVIVDIERVEGAPGRRVTGVTACHGIDERGRYVLELLEQHTACQTPEATVWAK
jgi:type IV secretion system protein TrbB